MVFTVQWRPNMLRSTALIGVAALAVGLAPSALAVLGGDLSTVAADQARLSAKIAVTPGARFTVHEMTVPSGTVVREFASPEGIVFAVAWQGPNMPDLQQVLGTYYATYLDALVQRRTRGPVAVELPGLVVQSSGHMRAFVGRAYLPNALPSGVTAETIR